MNKLYTLAFNILTYKFRSSFIGKVLFGKRFFYPKLFMTLYCGEPKIYGNIQLPYYLSQTYSVDLLSGKYRGSNTFIECRELKGIKDLDDNQVYEASNGVLFIYKYTPATADRIDEGYFNTPRFDSAILRSQSQLYYDISEKLVNEAMNKLNIDDELLKLGLINRVTALQCTAYQQGLQREVVKLC